MTKTAWGYEIVGDLGNMLSVDELQEMTGGILSSSYEQIEATMSAVSYAIRAFCGWHVTPNVECVWTGDADGRLAQLPAMGVTSIHSVKVNGADVDYDWRTSGLIRLKRPVCDDWGRLVVVDYEAGFDTEALASVVSQVAVNALVAPAGVMREQAGDVAITYNQTGAGVTGGIRLLSSDKQLLQPYKLPQTW